MIEKDVIIIGGGPAGLCVAKTALEAGLDVLLIDRAPALGGQLIKQTHKFFGSKSQYAKTRGIDIANILIDDLRRHAKLEILLATTAVGLYPGHVVSTYDEHVYRRYQGKAIVVATGASEKFLTFENNDLPGVYGAGAIQTLMNVYGIMPAQEVVMVGSGNIGLIVSYQLIQAGVKVKALVEAASSIGGYKVHASKIKRLGVDILTRTTVKKAIGKDHVEAVEIVGLDDTWNPIAGTEAIISTDAICISVGLSPMHQLLSMLGVDTKYVPELGGHVPVLDDTNQTSIEGVYACGDAAGIEEASSAMMEGYLTGLCIARQLHHPHPDDQALVKHYHDQLGLLREGPFGEKTVIGRHKLKEGAWYA